ncbi:oligosaccharide flippase family protein, partial [Streptococcus suis]
MSVSKLVKSGFIYTLGAVLIQGLSLITTPIYTRIISQEVYGQYSLYNSWVALISLFIGMQTVGSLPIAKVK